MNSKTKVIWGIAIALVVILSGGMAISAIAQSGIDTSQGDVVNESLAGEDNPVDSSGLAQENLPQGAVVDLIKATIENGWKLRLEAGLDRNRGLEADYKNRLSQYYSATAINGASFTDVNVDKTMQMPPQPPSEKQVEQIAPFQFVSPNASELEKQGNYIDYGRYNEKIAGFRAQDFGIDNITYLKIQIKDGNAEVVVDIKYWSEFVHTNPDGSNVTSRPHGGERHTFLLVSEGGVWRIISDTFTIIPGFEP